MRSSYFEDGDPGMRTALLTSITVILFPILTAQADTINIPADYPTIQEGIDAAMTGDTVLVAPGTYVENIDFLGKAITVQSSDGAATTVVDGDQSGSVAICQNGEGSDTVLDGFTLTNGTGTVDGTSQSGGGMYNLSTSPTVENCIFSNNSADYGGGMFNDCSYATIVNCTFIENVATYRGGGICNYHGGTFHTSVTVTSCIFESNSAGFEGGGMYDFRCDGTRTDCTFIGNSVSDGNGGGICIEQCELTVAECTFMDNEVNREGGGIYLDYGDSVITDSLIQHNLTTDGYGGGIAWRGGFDTSIQAAFNNIITENEAISGAGIYCESHSAPLIEGNTITKNIASDQGGGILCDQWSYPTISDNLISGNQAADRGGGIATYLAGPAIISNTIHRNYAEITGGGIFCESANPLIMNNIITDNDSIVNGGGISCKLTKPYIINNTLVGNQSESAGGGIYCSYGSELGISNTILWCNTAWSGAELYVEGAVFSSECSITHSDIAGGQAGVHVDPGCTLHWGEGMIDVDPLFVDPEQGDFHLQQDPCQPGVINPCVDSGCTVAYGLCLQTGWTRTDEETDIGIADMGFHYGPFSHPTLLLDTYQLPEAGGSIQFKLIPGYDHSFRNYLIVGGVCGTEHGHLLSGGLVTLPINLDAFTYGVLFPLLNTWTFTIFMSKIAVGGSPAYMNAPLIPGFAGVKMYFAYCLNAPFDFVSNPVEIEVVP
jgi:parallel beta-helix repeat protein